MSLEKKLGLRWITFDYVELRWITCRLELLGIIVDSFRRKICDRPDNLPWMPPFYFPPLSGVWSQNEGTFGRIPL